LGDQVKDGEFVRELGEKVKIMEVVRIKVKIKVEEVVRAFVWEVEVWEVSGEFVEGIKAGYLVIFGRKIQEEIVSESVCGQGEVFGIGRTRRQFIFAESSVKVSQQGS
jgi:hypothetical protein